VVQRMRSKLDARVQKLVGERYPASLIWWLDQVPRPGWAPWSRSEFLRVSARWREIARLAAGTDPVLKIYGDHARRALMSVVHHESWRLAHVPFMHLRKTLETLWVYRQVSGEDLPWLAWVQPLPLWINQLFGQPLGAGNAWVQAEAVLEAKRIVRCLELFTTEDSDPELKAAVGEVRRQLARLSAMFRGNWRESIEPPAWTSSADLDLAEWKRRRQSAPGPIALGETNPKGPLRLADVFVTDHHSEIVSVQGVSGGAWLLAREDAVTVVRSTRSDYAMLASDLKIWWWWQAKDSHALAWALADPIYIEAVILAAWSVLADDHSQLADLGLKQILSSLVRQNEALAVADAWLWLEQADPRLVAEWLGPFLGDDRARWAVSSLQLYPGYWMEREQIRQRLQVEMTESEGDLRLWRGWLLGPVPI